MGSCVAKARAAMPAPLLHCAVLLACRPRSRLLPLATARRIAVLWPLGRR
jgi:hypothetical protein